MSKDDGVVNIHGKQYLTVARRINDFRQAHPEYGVHTEILSIDDATVVCRAVITDGEGRQISSGIAEEHRRASKINSTSAVENCETSAVGRALAFSVWQARRLTRRSLKSGQNINLHSEQQLTVTWLIHAVAARENLDEKTQTENRDG